MTENVILIKLHSQSSKLLLIHLSFLFRPPRIDSPPSSTETNSHILGKTHVWVSARHGDISEWGPYSGVWLNVIRLFVLISRHPHKSYCTFKLNLVWNCARHILIVQKYSYVVRSFYRFYRFGSDSDF